MCVGQCFRAGTLLLFMLISPALTALPSVVAGSIDLPTTGLMGTPVVYLPDNASSIMQAVNMVAPGGTVYVKESSYEEDVYIDKPVAIIGLGEVVLWGSIRVVSTGNVSLVNLTVAISPPGSEVAILIHNSTMVRINGLHILYSNVMITGSTAIEVYDSLFEDSPSPAILVDKGSSNITIRGNSFSSTYTALTVISGSNSSFYYNRVYDARSYGVKLFSGAVGVRVFLNNFYNNTSCYDEGKGNIWYNQSLKLGNYWEEAVCNTGVGIDGPAGSIDEYPLCSPFENYLEQGGSTSSSSSPATSPSLNPGRLDPGVYIAAVSIAVALVVAIWIWRRGRQ